MKRVILLSAGLLTLAACSESAAKKAVADMLIDPGSAQFRNLSSQKNFVCGEVNGKNRMGAYTGFTPFFYDVNAKTSMIRNESAQTLTEAQADLNRCQSNQYSTDCKFEQDRTNDALLMDTFDSLYKINCGK